MYIIVYVALSYVERLIENVDNFSVTSCWSGN